MNPPADRSVLAGCDAGSPCTGIGGLDLALEHDGARIAWQAETDPAHATKTLARTWVQRQTSLTDKQGMSL